MKNFAIIGVGGYIAIRHLEVIKSAGHNLVAAYDISDSVGIMDRFFPDCSFFTEFERFEAYIDSLKGTQKQIDYVSVCTPNYLHASHSKFALSHGADVICEKPLTLTIKELDEVANYEKKFNKKVYTILQLRVHETILALKKKVMTENKDRYDIDLDYVTSRGNWYHESWKGDVKKSGGLSTNIGVHFFDMLTWIFGNVQDIKIEIKTPTLEKGTLKLERANVNWSLSVDRKNLPPAAVAAGKTTYRSIKIDGTEFEFSDGFTELHRKVYEDIFAGSGYGIESSRHAIEIVEKIRALK